MTVFVNRNMMVRIRRWQSGIFWQFGILRFGCDLGIVMWLGTHMDAMTVKVYGTLKTGDNLTDAPHQSRELI